MRLITPKNSKRIVKFLNTPAAGKYIPYGWGSNQILQFLDSDYVRNKQFKSRVLLLKEFLSNIDKQHSMNDMLPDLFVSSFVKAWRAMAISHFNKKAVNQYLNISGLDKFERSYKKNKGVIVLNSHWGLAETAIPFFPLIGYNDFYTVVREKGTDSMKFVGLKKDAQPKLIIFKDHSNAELFKSLYKARDVLKNGHIFHILGDGYHGKSSVDMNFLGRIRGFRGSFAELGLSTEAAIHPIFMSVQNNGTIDIEILDAIDKGEEVMDRQDRIIHMVKQYKSLLEDRWANYPQHINLGFMEKYLRQVHQNFE